MADCTGAAANRYFLGLKMCFAHNGAKGVALTFKDKVLIK